MMKIQKLLTVVGTGLMLAACQTAPEHTVDVASVPGSPEDFAHNVGDKVYFDFNKSNIRPDAAETLKKQAAWFNTYRDTKAQAVGHCDERGTTEYNLALGERRANAVEKFLEKHGVAKHRITVSSKGKEEPAIPNAVTEQEHQMNRRVHVIIDN